VAGRSGGKLSASHRRHGPEGSNIAGLAARSQAGHADCLGQGLIGVHQRSIRSAHRQGSTDHRGCLPATARLQPRLETRLPNPPLARQAKERGPGGSGSQSYRNAPRQQHNLQPSLPPKPGDAPGRPRRRRSAKHHMLDGSAHTHHGGGQRSRCLCRNRRRLRRKRPEHRRLTRNPGHTFSRATDDMPVRKSSAS